MSQDQEISKEDDKDDTITNSVGESRKQSAPHRESTCLCGDCVRNYKIQHQLDCDS